MPLFEAQFLIQEENIWFAEIAPYQAIQRQESVVVKVELLIADDAESAYEQACTMIDNLSEANFDGPGDITNSVCQGICQLREIVVGDDAENDQGQAQEIAYLANPIDTDDVRIRPKDELDVFRQKTW
jgi:hypothetical protein